MRYSQKHFFCYSFSHVARRIFQRVQEVLQVSEKLPEHCCTTESISPVYFFLLVLSFFFSALYPFLVYFISRFFWVLRILSCCSFPKIPWSIPTLTLIDLMIEGDGNFNLENCFWSSGLRKKCVTVALTFSR